jgi:hypothetical protein
VVRHRGGEEGMQRKKGVRDGSAVVKHGRCGGEDEEV